MKKISKLFMILALSLLFSPVTFAGHDVRCDKYYSYQYHRYFQYCYKTDYVYHGYVKFNPDGQVDTACVDACLDLEHTLNQCMRSCYY